MYASFGLLKGGRQVVSALRKVLSLASCDLRSLPLFSPRSVSKSDITLLAIVVTMAALILVVRMRNLRPAPSPPTDAPNLDSSGYSTRPTE